MQPSGVRLCCSCMHPSPIPAFEGSRCSQPSSPIYRVHAPPSSGSFVPFPGRLLRFCFVVGSESPFLSRFPPRFFTHASFRSHRIPLLFSCISHVCCTPVSSLRLSVSSSSFEPLDFGFPPCIPSHPLRTCLISRTSFPSVPSPPPPPSPSSSSCVFAHGIAMLPPPPPPPPTIATTSTPHDLPATPIPLPLGSSARPTQRVSSLSLPLSPSVPVDGSDSAKRESFFSHGERREAGGWKDTSKSRFHYP